MIHRDQENQNQVWLSQLESKKAGTGFYTFYSLRSALDTISGQCMARIERMERHVLCGQFERVETEFGEFLEQLPKTIEHHKEMIKKHTGEKQ